MQRPANEFVVLSDEPVEIDSDDLLGVSEVAASLVSLITGSRDSAPFTVAIDAGWGMGKSSLMRLMRAQLAAENVPTVWFNAWTSGPDALEVLIKSVLLRFDRNVVRRAYHRLARRRRIMLLGRLVLAVSMSLIGLRRLVDDIWAQLSADAKGRDEIRDVVREMAQEWVSQGDTGGRQLVVFIDDLDRCSAEVVLTVCEAIKLYLDVPGLVFVIGCDQAALGRNLRDGDGTSARAVEYLEKIVQVNYQVEVPGGDRSRRLVEGYLRRAGTSGLLGEQLTTLLVLRAKRNPRRIKRLLNSFVLQYHLDARWREFGADVLLRIVLLQHFYPEFHHMLALPDERDPVPEFLGYVTAREEVRLGETPTERELFASHGVAPPLPGDDGQAAVERLAQELPVSYPALAADHDFVSLIRELNEDEGYVEWRGRAEREPRRYPGDSRVPDMFPGTSAGSIIQIGQVTDINVQAAVSNGPPGLDGLRVLWVDDEADEALAETALHAERLTSRGAVVEFATDLPSVRAALRKFAPDVIISDIARAEAEYAGIDDVQALRHSGDYYGPVIFYVARVTPNRLRRAKELGAEGVTNDSDELFGWIAAVARRQRKDHR